MYMSNNVLLINIQGFLAVLVTAQENLKACFFVLGKSQKVMDFTVSEPSQRLPNQTHKQP